MRNEKEFKSELTNLINRWSIDNEAATPDFILADYIVEQIEAYTKAMVHREQWFVGSPISRLPNCIKPKTIELKP
jgi:hypothetical protein